VIRHLTGLQLHAVAADGDGVDYAVKREDEEFALESSGTRTGDLQGRHREKVRQLLASPLRRGQLRGRGRLCRPKSDLFVPPQ
jgi:hypothetical protein